MILKNGELTNISHPGGEVRKIIYVSSQEGTMVKIGPSFFRLHVKAMILCQTLACFLQTGGSFCRVSNKRKPVRRRTAGL